MKKVIRINKDGYFIEDVLLQDNKNTPKDCVEVPCKEGLYKPKFVNGEWIEGLTEEELNIIKNTPLPKSELELTQDNIAFLGSQLFEAQTQILQAESDKVTLGQQLFSLQTQLMTKGVL